LESDSDHREKPAWPLSHTASRSRRPAGTGRRSANTVINVREVALASGMEELKQRLEVLLGAVDETEKQRQQPV
jgi:hypothetical protein